MKLPKLPILARRHDLDARLRGVSVGHGGRVAPKLRDIGLGQIGEPIFCISCGKRSGYVTADLPPGVIAVCDDCHAGKGALPLELVHYQPD